ncbi:beta-propeller fold lactonase family protein [Demequina sp. NBRC 110053]|uniref:lactonase family protein n=1 Tax=Demequina sp. NBRC 110053 TaxID=1570342 RepID=UPI000A0128A0|nr:beta-propeller fold lactonase family protein [Demequina sp. NBRC 110053]
MTQTTWWGTFPAAGNGTPVGRGEGLWRQRGEDVQLVLELPAPAFVIAHPGRPLLYAITESDDSAVHAIDVSDPDAPAVIATVPTGGRAGCHLSLAPGHRALYASHYMSGDVAVIALGETGAPVGTTPAQVFGHEGRGPREDRQEAPHAHFSGLAPGGRHLLVCDLGTDELRRYSIRPDGLLDDDGIAAVLPAGAGPRHFAVRGDLIYVTCELDNRLRVLRWDGANAVADVIEDLPSTTAVNRTGEAGLQDGHILIHGDVVLVAVRGADVIALFDLGPEGEARYRTSFDVGEWPRHFAIAHDRLLVASERGHDARWYPLAEVLALPPEREVGEIATVPHASAPIPSAACACPELGPRIGATLKP